MSSLSLAFDAAIRKLIGDRCHVKAVLAINGAGAATVKTTNAIIYSIGGVMLTKAALAAQSIAITHDAFGNLVASGVAAYVQPVLTTVVYVLSLDASGNVAVSQGTYAGQNVKFANDVSKVYLGTGGVPVEPAGFTAFGAIKVALANAATFTPGTTALDATDVTATYSDIAILPTSL